MWSEFRNTRLRPFLIVLLVMYGVGVASISLLPEWNVAALTPLNLILSFGILLYFQLDRPATFWGLTAAFFALGFGVEVLGVSTGFPFGDYHYGNNLGPKLFAVPLVIGVNWAMLVLITGSLSASLPVPKFVRAAAGATWMVLLDLLIEQMAELLDFWYWAGESIPVENYVAWWVIAYIMLLGFHYGIKSPFNPLARFLFTLQLVFFGLLNLFLG